MPPGLFENHRIYKLLPLDGGSQAVQFRNFGIQLSHKGSPSLKSPFNGPAAPVWGWHMGGRLESVASTDMYKGAPCKVIRNLESICMLIEEWIVWLGNSLDGIN